MVISSGRRTLRDMPQRLPSVPGRILVAARAQDDDRAVVHYAAELFAFLVVALRLGGKRELAQINVMDLAVLLLASNALQNAMIGNDNLLLGGVLGASVLFAANYVFVRVTYRSERIRRVLEGPPRARAGRPARRANAAPRGDLGQRVTFGRSRARPLRVSTRWR
jgi:hypothetical protein